MENKNSERPSFERKDMKFISFIYEDTETNGVSNISQTALADFLRKARSKRQDRYKHLPDSWFTRRLLDFAETPLQPIATKLNEWDFKSPLVVSILGRYSGTGKTHLATALMNLYNANLEEQLAKDIFDFFYEMTDGYYCSEDHISKGNVRILNVWLRTAFATILEQGYTEHEFASDKLVKLNQLFGKVKQDFGVFVSAKSISYEVQQSFAGTGYDALTLLNRYTQPGLLVLDDILSMKTTDFERQNLFYIIDERMQFAEKPTIITSNKTIEEIGDLDSRIADRMSNSMCFEIFTNKSWRQEK